MVELTRREQAWLHLIRFSSQSIFKSAGETFNHLTFTGSGIKSFASPVTANGNVIINSGSSVAVTTSNYQFTIKGNLTNNGTFNTQNGLVFFNGSTLQTIGGTSITDFYDLTLNNSAGAILSQAENLIGTMTLNGGTFNTNSQIFTMISNAAGTARIAQITGTGDIIGNVTVQRFAPGGTTGWALIGTPISSALTLNDWDDNIYISCPTCPDGSGGGFLSIYRYDETIPGVYSNTVSYIPLNTINDPIIPNKGYWVYLGDGPITTNNIMIDVTGTVRKSNQTIPLDYTNYGSPPDDGWNLIHNPYPSPISWTALKGATSNIDDAIYVYNADLNGGAGAHATYINGVSSPAIGSGGIGDAIPMCQGFYVHSTGATALNGLESNKVGSNQVFLRATSQNTITSLLRLNMSGGPYNFNDEIVLYEQLGATTNFDANFDAFKMAGQDPYAPQISIEEANMLFQVNGIAPVYGTYTTSLKTLTGYSGNYTISISGFTTFPVGACFNLYDKFTTTSTDLTNSNYIFDLEDTTTVSRFILSITLNSLQITSAIQQPTCKNINGGKIAAEGVNAGPWNYYWKDVNGNTVQIALNKNTSDTLQGLWNGTYDLDITTVGMCDNNHSTYTIIKKDPAYANFTCLDTCYLNQNAIIQFNNTSANSVSQLWNFGDQIGTSVLVSPTYQYHNSGNYLVSLIANSPNGCIDTIVKPIVVSDKPVGIKSIPNNDYVLMVKNLGNNKFVIEKELSETNNLNYVLMDASGKMLFEQNNIQTNKLNIDLDLSNYKSGVYFLNIYLNKKLTAIKLPVSK